MEANNPTDIYRQFVDSPLVPMTLRVAVAGHREHSNIRVDNQILVDQISALYRLFYDELKRCHSHPHAARLYADAPPCLRIISSLADGADRLLLEPSLVGQNFELACVLPFAAQEYANDFAPDSREFFYQLLDKAAWQTPQSRVLELNGSRESEEHAYRDCGMALVKNCDILVALYDGKHRDGFGTAWTVEQALAHKIPVIWIDIEHPNHMHFIQRRNGNRSLITFSANEMRDWLGHMLLFDTILEQPQQTDLAEKILTKFDHYREESSVIHDTPGVIDFNDAGPISSKPHRLNPLGHGFSLLKSLLTPRRSVNKRLDAVQQSGEEQNGLNDGVDHLCELFHNPASHTYYAAYLRADRLASFYATLHRSIFVFIYLLGASALLIAAFAIAVSDPEKYGKLATYCAIAELVILFLVVYLYKQDHRRELHDKWLEYRCIAEFLRPTLYLSFFGTNFPMRRFRDNEETLGRNLLGHGGPERCWAYLYTETVIRWAGFSGHRIDQDYLKQAVDFTRCQWLGQQYRYHTKNAIAMKLLSKRLAKISEVMFWTTVIIVVAKISMSLASVYIDYLSKGLGLLATWLPVIGTTSFAIRNHAEFEISAQRSLSAREVLLGFNQQLRAAQTNQASLLTLDALLTDLTAQSISETADWLEIYEVKESEAG